MDGIGFVFIDSLGVLVGIVLLLITIALGGWFGAAVGNSVNDEFGSFVGMLIGIVVTAYLIFSV